MKLEKGQVNGIKMYCLDTYALIEIANGNPKFSFLMREEFMIINTTLAEFYWVLLREKGKEDAEYWVDKLSNFTLNITKEIMLKAQNFRFVNKKKNLSFFDCVGYIFSKENNYIFVTGDKEFKDLEGVEFIQK